MAIIYLDPDDISKTVEREVTSFCKVMEPVVDGLHIPGWVESFEIWMDDKKVSFSMEEMEDIIKAYNEYKQEDEEE